MATQHEIELPAHTPMGYLARSNLIRRAQSGDLDAICTVWLNNARLAYSTANQIRVRPELVADLVQQSQLALPRAIQRFDVSRLLEFSTYAHAALRREMYRHAADIAFSTRIPPNLTRPYFTYRRRVAHASHPSSWFDARSEYLDESPRGYERLRRLHALAEPLPLKHARHITTEPLDPARQLIADETRAELARAMAELNRRERFVLLRRYGLDGEPQQTLDEVGSRFRLTRERVRQIQLRAELKLAGLLEKRQAGCVPCLAARARVSSTSENPNAPRRRST
jgi:RNA polymerase sigma factor (sigma-70 family)